MWGQLRIIQGGHLKIREAGKNSNMRGYTKFLGDVKIEGACYRGVFKSIQQFYIHSRFTAHLSYAWK